MADRYLEDKTLQKDYYDSGIINAKNLLIGSGLLIGGVAGYKSGLFKEAISETLKMAAEHKPRFSILANNLKKWINSEGLEETEKSIFRNKITSTAKDLISFDKSKIKKVYEDTIKDFADYVDRVGISTELAKKKSANDIIYNTAKNTDLLRDISDNTRAKAFYSESLKKSKETLNSKLNESTVKRHIESREAVAKSIKRTGLRKAELGDLFDFYIDTKGKIRLIEKTNFSFSKSAGKNKTAKNKIEELLNSKVIDENGVTLNINGKDINMHEYIKDWKHMNVDKHLHINEKGEFVDLRNRVIQNTTFFRNLALDWKFPVININPLRLLGVDKIGRRQFNTATISENTLAPALTGVYGKSKENTIKNLKDKVDILKGINEGVTIIDGDVYRLNKNGSITKLKYNSKKNITFIPKEHDKGTSYLNKRENAQRKMFGLNRTEYIEYTEEELAKMGKLQQYIKKAADFLDIGRQERQDTKWKIGFKDIDNYDSYLESIISKISKKVNPYKEIKETDHISALFDFDDRAKDSFFITNRGTGLRDIFNASKQHFKDGKLNDINKVHYDRFLSQYIGSFASGFENVNDKTSIPYFFIERLNQGLSSIGLGLSTKNTKSTGNTFVNLITKRFLPIYGAYQAWNFINMFGEDNTDNGTKPGNLDQHIKYAIAKMDIGVHKIGDVFGVPKVFKVLSDVTPGSDMLAELPGVNLFSPTQTAEERKDYWENGYTPVRKGRYWSLNTTPFVGDNISYWKPNMLRESLADAKFSDSLYGSRKEYFLNFLNPHHYDRKNYYTRPYLMTSPAFENVPIFGPLLSTTFGRIISPQQKMHKEYWNEDGTVKTPIQLNEEQKALGYLTTYNSSFTQEQEKAILTKYKDMNTLRTVYNLNQNSTANNIQYNDYLLYAYNNSPVNQVEYNKNLYQLMTSSGNTQTIGFGGEYASFSKNKINKNGYTLGQIQGADNRVSLNNQYAITNEITESFKYINPTNPNNFINSFKNQFDNSMDVAGIYGFGVTGFVTGDVGAGSAQIETSGYSRSFNRTFWDQDLGGLSGDFSEIFRRLIQKKRTDIDYYNPIRNRMACLLSDTDVIMYNGDIKKANEIKTGDELLSNKGTKTIVNNIAWFDANEKVNITLYGDNYHINSFSWNHPIYMSSHTFKNAIDVKKSEYVCFPRQKYNDSLNDMIDISELLNCDKYVITKKYIYYGKSAQTAIEREIAEEYNFDISKIPIELKRKYKKLYDFCRYQKKVKNDKKDIIQRINRYINGNDLYYLIGVYAAEGSKSTKKSIKLSGHVNDKWENKIKEIFSKYNISYSCQDVENSLGRNFITYCSPINEILTNVCPGNAKNKKIEYKIYNTRTSKKSWILNLVKGFIDGDGCSIITKDNRVKIGYTTISEMLANQLKIFIINTCGIFPSITKTVNKKGREEYRVYTSGVLANKLGNILKIKYNRHEYIPKQNNQHQYSDDDYVYIKVKDVEIIKESCKVIGYSVDGNHTFCTINIATHNTWLPGKNGFIDMQHGDAYAKITKGELRLPGEGYERLHHISMPTLLKMNVGSSTIGKSKDEIIKHFLHQDEITDPEALKITKEGTRIHEQMEKKLIASGIAIDTEKEIKDEENGVIGYYDARIYDPSSPSRQAIVDIKTVSNKKFKKVKETNTPFDEHQRQVNFYLHNTDKNNKGYITYVNRENPEETYTIGFNYNKKMYKSTMATLKSARQEINNMLHQGIISRGDLYNPIDRYRILADVAPYSDEYEALNKQMSNMDLSKSEQEEVKAIRDRVAAQRQQSRFYNYRFKNNDVIIRKAEIENQIDKQTFTIKGSDTPIKLAGLKINKGNKHYKEAQTLIDEYLSPEKNVKILMAEDPSQRKNNDMLGTIKATVISNGVNVNRELIKKGLVEEDKDDFSAAGIKARFNELERGFGSAWENVAHFDSGFNTKLLQVRTPLEDYERKQVYGKDFRDWKHPIKDFIMPSIYTNINRNIIYGTVMGGLIGKAAGNTRFGALVGGTVGVGSVLVGKMYKQIYKSTTGEEWIPAPVRKKREIEDYMDKLTFIKNRRLYEVYAKKALEEDHFDVGAFLSKNNAMGNVRKTKANKIQKVKNDYKRSLDFDIDRFEDAGVKFNWKDKYLPGFIRSIFTHDNDTRLNTLKERTSELFAKDDSVDKNGRKKRHKSKSKKWEDFKEAFKDYNDTSKNKKTKSLEKSVNSKINEYTNYKRAFKIPINAMKAIEYYNKSEATMYGYDPGEPLTNIVSALPKADKKYFREFINAPEKDRQRILEVAPKYMRRALQSSYGMKVDPKESLNSYFKEHYLPGQDWAGWDENVDLKAMKVKLVQTQGERLQDYNLWKDDKLKADLYGKIDVPNINYKTKNASVVKSKLEDLLGKAGYKNISIDIKHGSYKPTINLNAWRSNEEKYKSQIDERMNNI